MNNIKFIYKGVAILGVFLLLTGCSTKTNNNEVKEKQISNNDTVSNSDEVQLNLKSKSRSCSPLCDNTDINKNISVNKGNMANNEVINSLMTILFDRYKVLNDSSVAIEDYTIKKINTVLETKKGSVFGVLYSVKGNTSRTKWDANEQSDKWTTTKQLYCSYYEQGDEYVLNIIGENPLYYKGNEDKLNTEEIAKKLFEDLYLAPRLFDGNKSSRLLSYSIDKVESYVPGDNTEHRLLFNIEYSIQGIKGNCSWICADEEGKGSLSSNWELISIGDFYEIEGAD